MQGAETEEAHQYLFTLHDAVHDFGYFTEPGFTVKGIDALAHVHVRRYKYLGILFIAGLITDAIVVYGMPLHVEFLFFFVGYRKIPDVIDIFLAVGNNRYFGWFAQVYILFDDCFDVFVVEIQYLLSVFFT